MEKLDYLINYLLKENTSIKISDLPSNIEDKKRLSNDNARNIR